MKWASLSFGDTELGRGVRRADLGVGLHVGVPPPAARQQFLQNVYRTPRLARVVRFALRHADATLAEDIEHLLLRDAPQPRELHLADKRQLEDREADDPAAAHAGADVDVRFRLVEDAEVKQRL